MKQFCQFLGIHYPKKNAFAGKVWFLMNRRSRFDSLGRRIETDFVLHAWEQPEHFFSNKTITGASADFKGRYSFSKSVSGFVAVNAKAKGWVIGNLYLKSNVAIRAGFNLDLRK